MRQRRVLRRLHENIDKKKTRVQRRAANESVPEPGQLVRNLNTRVREIIKRLPHQRDYSLAFFCECGCSEPVQLTIDQYDALEGKAVLRAGHPVPTARLEPPSA